MRPAGHSGGFCKLFQNSFVSGSECGPELRHAGSLNEMAPKFLKWFNKTYTDCNVQFIVAHYCPQLGKMTSSRQYYFQLHDSSPLLAISPTHRAILFRNKAGGAKGARHCACQRPVRCRDKRISRQMTLTHRGKGRCLESRETGELENKHRGFRGA